MKHLFNRTLALLLLLSGTQFLHGADRPHIVLVMADDQGWGQTGYFKHPHLKTPNLDDMASNGLRFDRFYAGASNCSPTRATVLTGRSNDRTGVFHHGYPLRAQEKTVAQALQKNGYRTGHFGKWHLNGLRGPGVPILKEDSHHPGNFGFDTWFSVTNFFDYDPLLSRQGEIESHQGDSSEIIVKEALKFLEINLKQNQPLFTVIWFGSPHSPMIANAQDRALFADLPEKHQHHLGELVAMDRSIGTLRSGLKRLGIAENTLLWFNSDNGGLPGFGKETVGYLRGNKGLMYEGGLRVPAIIEWPSVIKTPRTTSYRACTVDIFSTLAEAANLPATSMLQPQDGLSLFPLFNRDIKKRSKPLFFHHRNRGVVIDGDLKLISQEGKFEQFNLADDDEETRDLYDETNPTSLRLKEIYLQWKQTLETSRSGKDYPEGQVAQNQPERRFWKDDPAYQPHLERFQQNVNQ
ncbi:sulfatase-like hydrolase/transferase [bacterium]|nr:sulfatase-like hydrolase/transferase [bacterium]MDA7645337.1 sulfatase-like hydrolase/transferase [bacterium]MDB4796563.1 sulfatase-like hydrolase/transferase [bacterium]